MFHRTLPALTLLLGLCATAPSPAQDTLADLQRRFIGERDRLVEAKGGSPTFEDFQDLGRQHAEVLRGWLEGRKGADAVNGRLMLADIWINVGEEEKARETLQSIDVESAPALELATAAEMAQMVGLHDLRRKWIDAAVAKDAPFEERMALAIVLMTRLVEVERGEAILDAALEAAQDDEERAKVLWYRAAAIREREDLPDGSFDEALGELAEQYPKTRFGGIARDRLRAMQLDVGVDAIPFTAPTLGGGEKQLADWQGKVVLLEFWAPGVRPDPIDFLKELRDTYGERGFEIVTVVLGNDRAEAQAAARQTGRDWTLFFDGQGFQADAALRWGVEVPLEHVLLDREQKVAAMRLFLRDERSRKDLVTAIEKAL